MALINDEYGNDAVSNKLQRLQENKQRKLNALTSNQEQAWQPAMLESMTDADSPQFVGVEGRVGSTGKYDLTGQLTEDRLLGFDAYEVPHPGDPYKDSESGQRKYAEQKAKLAGERGVPVESITDDMLYQEGTREQLEALYNLIPGEKAEWTPGPLDFINEDTPLELGSKEYPLNIPVERRDSGKGGYFGRPLTDVRNADTDENVRESLGYTDADAVQVSAMDKYLAAKLDPNSDKGKLVALRREAFSEYAPDYTDIKDTDNYAENLIDAAQYGVGSAGARVLDAAADAVLRTVKEVSGKSEADANQWITDKVENTILEGVIRKGDFVGMNKYKMPEEYGYDDKAVTAYINEFKDTFTSDESSVYDKALMVLKAIPLGPEVLASSSGDMLLGMTGIPGLAVMAMGQTNEVLEERAKNKGTTDLDAMDYGIATASGVLYSAVNMFTRGNIGVQEARKIAKEAITRMDKEALGFVIKKLVTAGGGEGLEEIFQGSTEVVGTKLLTPKEDEILSKETAIDLAAQGALGMGGGVAPVVGKTAIDAAQPLKGKIDRRLDEIAKRGEEARTKAAKPEPTEQPEIDVEPEVLRDEDIDMQMANAKGAMEDSMTETMNSDEAISTRGTAGVANSAVDLMDLTLEKAEREGKDLEEVIDSEEFKDLELKYKSNITSIKNKLVSNTIGTLGKDASEAERELQMEAFKRGLETSGLNEDSRTAILTNILVPKMGTKTFDDKEVPDINIPEGAVGSMPDMDNIGSMFGIDEAELDALIAQAPDLDTIPDVTAPPEGLGIAEMQDIPVTEEATKEKIQQDIADEKETAKKPTDEELGVGSTKEDGYIKGISARTVNKLADTFGIEPKAVVDALKMAMPAMKIKTMKAVSKAADKVQYDMYYGDKGMIPTYMAYKKAVQQGKADVAYAHISTLRKGATRLERAVYRDQDVRNYVKSVANETLDDYNDGKIPAQQVADELTAFRAKLGEKYTITAKDVVYDTLPDEVKKLVKAPTSKALEVLQAQEEALAHYDQLLGDAGVGRVKPKYKQVKVADRIEEYTKKIQEDEAKVQEIEKQLGDETRSGRRASLEKLLESRKEDVEKSKEILKNYKTKYPGREFISREVYLDEEQKGKVKEATDKVIDEKLGQGVGKVTRKEEEKKKAKGIEVDEGNVEETTRKVVKGVSNLLKDLDKTYESMEELDNAVSSQENTALEYAAQLRERARVYSDKLKAMKDDKSSMLLQREALQTELQKANHEVVTELEKLNELEKEYKDNRRQRVDIQEGKAKYIKADDKKVLGTMKELLHKIASWAKSLGLKMFYTRNRVRKALEKEGKIVGELKAVENSIAELNSILEDRKVLYDKAEKIDRKQERRKLETEKRDLLEQVRQEKLSANLDDRLINSTDLEYSGRGIILEEITRELDAESRKELEAEVKKITKHLKAAVFTYKDAKVKDAKTFEEEVNKKTGATASDDSPMRLLLNKDGEYDPVVAEAVALSIIDYVSTNAADTAFNDEDTILKMLGMRAGMKVHPGVKKEMAYVGSAYKLEVSKVGKQARKSLGIQQNENADARLEARLDADMGTLAMEVMIRMGIMEYRQEGITSKKRDSYITAINEYNGIQDTTDRGADDRVAHTDKRGTPTVRINLGDC